MGKERDGGGGTEKMIYFITAPPRSGTSMVARLLHQHGVWIGRTIAGDEHNEHGYFEHVGMVKITKQIMKKNNQPARADAELFVTWGNVNKIRAPHFRERIIEIVGERKTWLYKDAKLLHLYPLFAKAFPKAVWILPLRDTEKILNSIGRHKIWQRRQRKFEGTKEEFWQGMQDMVHRLKVRQNEIMARSPHISVSPDYLIESEDYAEQFVRWCGLDWSKAAYDKAIDKRIWSG